MKIRLLYIFIFVLIAGSVVYWWRNISFGFEESDQQDLVQLVVDRDHKLVIGSTDATPEDVYSEFGVFVDYLEESLAQYGVQQIEIQYFEDSAHAARAMRQGRLDIYIDSTFSALMIAELAEGEVVLNRWKGGVEKASSEIFAKNGFVFESLDDLKGKTIAFEFHNSTPSYFLPKADLLSQGLSVREIDPDKEWPAEDEVGYYFTGDEVLIVEDVRSGKADLGALADFEHEEFLGIDDEFTVVHTTDSVYRHLVIFRDDLDAVLGDQIKQFLLDLDDTIGGRLILGEFSKTRKFEEVDDLEDLANVEQLLEFIELEILH